MNSEKLASLAGVSKRQLDTWVVKGWVKADQVPGMGRGGVERDFKHDQVEIARRMGALVNAGVFAGKAAKLAQGDRTALDALLAAVGPCVGMGELRYRLPQQGSERRYGAAGAREAGPACARPPLPDCVGAADPEPCG